MTSTEQNRRRIGSRIRGRCAVPLDVGSAYLSSAGLRRRSPAARPTNPLGGPSGRGFARALCADEPTIGLHPRDNRRLLDALKRLRDLGNTLLVVEHDREVVSDADQLLDFGPAAGQFGGQIVARGTPEQVGKRRGSVTGPYLSGKKAIPIPTNRRMPPLSPQLGLGTTPGQEKQPPADSLPAEPRAQRRRRRQ